MTYIIMFICVFIIVIINIIMYMIIFVIDMYIISKHIYILISYHITSCFSLLHYIICILIFYIIVKYSIVY